MKYAPLIERFSINGLLPAPSQVFGNVRLVPLLRETPSADLRIAAQHYGESAAIVNLGGGRFYGCSYVPHGFVIGYTEDGSPLASYGAALRNEEGGKKFSGENTGVVLHHRLVKRNDAEDGGRRLRLLPQLVAFEGFLSLCFHGPDVAWTVYSRRAISRGLSPRMEEATVGYAVPYLEDALRMFEVHDSQCGLLLFVGDYLAEVFIVSHPDDYRALHYTLLADSFSETLLQAAAYTGVSPGLAAQIPSKNIDSLSALRKQLARFKAELGKVHLDMAGDLVGTRLTTQRVYQAGPFSLQRFMTSLDLSSSSHIGELIVRNDGQIEYARTYRLSATQQRRGFLLKNLSANMWNLEATARALQTSREQLIVRIEKAGFGYLIAEHVLNAARTRKR